MNNKYTRLFTLFEQLKSELMGTLLFLEDVEKREELIKKAEDNFLTRHRDFKKKEEALTAKEAEQTRTNEYLVEQAVILGKKAQQIEEGKKELKELEEKRKELGKKQEEIIKLSKTLEERVKEAEGLVERETKIIEDQAVITKEKAIDRERKRLLDLRVQRIRQREQQLQLDQEHSEL